MAPVTLRLEIAEIERVFQADLDARDAAGDAVEVNPDMPRT